VKDWAIIITVAVVAILTDRTVSQLAWMVGKRLDDLEQKIDTLQEKLEEIESKLDDRSSTYSNPIDL